MKITLAQINPTVGALRENCSKIKEIMDRYSSECDIIVFPEMVLTGYPPQDLLLDKSFLVSAERSLGRDSGTEYTGCYDIALRPGSTATLLTLLTTTKGPAFDPYCYFRVKWLYYV